jgi:hypothetical protein
MPNARRSAALVVLICRSYGSDQLPSGPEALDELFNAFPSWFLRVTSAKISQPTTARRW